MFADILNRVLLIQRNLWNNLRNPCLLAQALQTSADIVGYVRRSRQAGARNNLISKNSALIQPDNK